ncbi:pantetheine-phosphate adenylyltransferase [Nocardioides sp. KR10-350]|uniref:pantetheine-phosphate adenylyltransferase n=1 Tax=Nocardioides cheoyonin TaxID=3156615 RepID=UPI0032B50AA0
MVRRAVCPGSFDPVTNGHIDIIGRAAALFDEVIVGVGVNRSKSASSSKLFTADERMAMIRDAVTPWPNVRVEGFSGLVTEFCREVGAVAIVKGLRGSSDYDYELQMAQMNSHLTDVETVFLMTDPGMSFVSSSLVKEVASFGGDVADFVPAHVLTALTQRLAERREQG